MFGSARIAAPDVAQSALDLLRAQIPPNPTAADKRRLHVAARHLAYARYYDEARAFSIHLSAHRQSAGARDFVIVTGLTIEREPHAAGKQNADCA